MTTPALNRPVDLMATTPLIVRIVAGIAANDETPPPVVSAAA
jgi:hypothetical protein